MDVVNSVLDELTSAIVYDCDEVVPCPFTEIAPEGKVVVDIPEELRGVLRLYHKLMTRAKEINDTATRADEGRWFRASNLANAVRYLLEDALRKKLGMPSRGSFEYWAGYKVSHSGP